MSGTTTNLSLFKYNPNTDGDQTFNIDNALNNNWDSLDSLIGALTNLTTTQKASLVGAINEIVTNMGGKAAKDLGNLDATGQAIIDAKIEAEALTAQNGYIKFKLNGISTPIILQWLYVSNNANQSSKTVSLPTSFTNTSYTACATHFTTESSASNPFLRGLKITSSSQITVVCQAVSYALSTRVIAVGY